MLVFAFTRAFYEGLIVLSKIFVSELSILYFLKLKVACY